MRTPGEKPAAGFSGIDLCYRSGSNLRPEGHKMKDTIKPRRSPLIRTLSFTEPEHRRIERAATSCGRKASESALWAREILLGIVDGVLRERKARTSVSAQR